LSNEHRRADRATPADRVEDSTLKKKSPKRKPSRGAEAEASASDTPMDVRLLEKLVRLMSDNDLSVVDVRDGDKRVILKRGGAFENFGGGSAAPMPRASTAPAPSSPTPAPADEDAGLVAIKSPMVGTFYAASSPDAPPMVSVGDKVDEDTDVCIIEAMKVFNNIRAETRGTIAKALVQNGQTVEFGQPLFLVKPS
jgi:acetyl-CoA carboxylase biotin carboxyl carrier protein